jgi:hypothetical protein
LDPKKKLFTQKTVTERTIAAGSSKKEISVNATNLGLLDSETHKNEIKEQMSEELKEDTPK